MIYKVIITEQAEQDLENIADYISEDNPIRAISFIKEIRQYLENRLAYFPYSAKLITQKIRMLPYKRYGILYLTNKKENLVKVLYIFSGGQNWENNIQ